MKKFKLWRNTSLILFAWTLVSALYIVLAKFEKFNCCALEVDGYRIYPLIQWIYDAKYAPVVDCFCDAKNLPTTFWIIPIDIIIVSVLALVAFVYIQFFWKQKTLKQGINPLS